MNSNVHYLLFKCILYIWSILFQKEAHVKTFNNRKQLTDDFLLMSQPFQTSFKIHP